VSGAQSSAGAEAAGDGNIAADGVFKMNGRNFGALEKEFGGFPDDWSQLSFCRGAREGDFVVEIDGEAEGVESGTEVAGAGGNADGNRLHGRTPYFGKGQASKCFE